MEKSEPTCTVGGSVKWGCCYGKASQFLKKLKIELPYDPAIPSLCIYPKESSVGPRKDICTSMFLAALFQAVEATQMSITR